jgi:hypothetical protein
MPVFRESFWVVTGTAAPVISWLLSSACTMPRCGVATANVARHMPQPVRATTSFGFGSYMQHVLQGKGHD